MNKKEHVNIK